ncbi:hypothetical protein EVAR_82046_1 [Eumeta japonica]|uniref:Uncharacterized protein n=1 Tax=Eumeta variegata TaxID=151549 RepID=A0A4C1XIH8_EUMVA|nr:hypothetical protein EVAR_82046_1 [Eumeta japonica]
MIFRGSFSRHTRDALYIYRAECLYRTGPLESSGRRTKPDYIDGAKGDSIHSTEAPPAVTRSALRRRRKEKKREKFYSAPGKIIPIFTAQKSMTHCRVPPEPSARARALNERPLFHSIGRCVRVEERQRPHTTYTSRKISQIVSFVLSQQLPRTEPLETIRVVLLTRKLTFYSHQRIIWLSREFPKSAIPKDPRSVSEGPTRLAQGSMRDLRRLLHRPRSAQASRRTTTAARA